MTHRGINHPHSNWSFSMIISPDCMWIYQTFLPDTRIQCCYKGLTYLHVCHWSVPWSLFRVPITACRVQLCLFTCECDHLSIANVSTSPLHHLLYFRSLSAWIMATKSVCFLISTSTVANIPWHSKWGKTNNPSQVLCIYFFSVSLHESDCGFVFMAAAAFLPRSFILLLFDWDSNIPRES